MTDIEMARNIVEDVNIFTDDPKRIQEIIWLAYKLADGKRNSKEWEEMTEEQKIEYKPPKGWLHDITITKKGIKYNKIPLS